MPGRRAKESGPCLATAALTIAALLVTATPAGASTQNVTVIKSRTVTAGSAYAMAAKKKGKGKATAATTMAAVPLSPGSQQTATANCPGKTHVSGGGWSVSPVFTPNGLDTAPGGSGTRITHLQSQSNGNTSRTVGGVSGIATIPISQGSTVTLNCSPGTHVLTGGFSLSPAGNLAVFNDFRPIVVESRRLDVDTWQIHVINPQGAASVATLFANVVCERNAKGVTVTEAAAIVPVANNGRTSATATCTGRKHVVGGGFLLSPLTGPAVGIDQMQPVGSRAWQVGLYEYPGFNLPAGSSLAAYGYCKNDRLPGKKKR